MSNDLDINKEAKALSKKEWIDLYLEHAKGNRDDIIPFPNESIQAM